MSASDNPIQNAMDRFLVNRDRAWLAAEQAEDPHERQRLRERGKVWALAAACLDPDDRYNR